jgi:hypothetical protein
MSELFTESHHFVAACATAPTLNVLIPASSRTLRR